jgi:hypothetical protein
MIIVSMKWEEPFPSLENETNYFENYTQKFRHKRKEYDLEHKKTNQNITLITFKIKII